MKHDEVYDELKKSYSIFKNEGASEKYKEISQNIIRKSATDKSTLTKLAIHFIYINDLHSLQSSMDLLSEEQTASVLRETCEDKALIHNLDAIALLIRKTPIIFLKQTIIRLEGINNLKTAFIISEELTKHKIEYKNDLELLLLLSNVYLKRQHQDKAKKMLMKALSIDPTHCIGNYNLAILYEESGDFKKAKELFYKNLFQHSHTPSLSRLLNIESKGELTHLIEKYKDKNLKGNNKEDLADYYYSLGNAYDKLGNYTVAFTFYEKANTISKSSKQTTDPLVVLAKQKKINFRLDNSESPLFICGMFRSGSTLLEQIIASHSEFSSGGEIPFFNLKTLDSCIKNKEFAEKLASIYLEKIQNSYGKINKTTNKLPDNFLYLGLIKSLFPKAKFIITKRNIIDNCLSIYFQNMSAEYPYATSLHDIKKYYLAQEKIVSYWKSLYPSDVLIMEYESLIYNPKDKTKEVCDFLNITYEDTMLEFNQLNNHVRTASYYQVRQKLHSDSINRHKNYRDNLQGLF